MHGYASYSHTNRSVRSIAYNSPFVSYTAILLQRFPVSHSGRTWHQRPLINAGDLLTPPGEKPVESVCEQRGIRRLPELHKKQAGDSSHLPRVTAITVHQLDRGYHLMHDADGMTGHAALTYRNAARYPNDLGTKPLSIRFSDSDAHLTFA